MAQKGCLVGFEKLWTFMRCCTENSGQCPVLAGSDRPVQGTGIYLRLGFYFRIYGNPRQQHKHTANSENTFTNTCTAKKCSPTTQPMCLSHILLSNTKKSICVYITHTTPKIHKYEHTYAAPSKCPSIQSVDNNSH